MHVVTNPRAASASVLARLRAELEAIPAAQVLGLNVNVQHAVATITMSLPRVRQLQPRMLVELPRFDTTLLDRLPDYARALFEAHLQCQTIEHDPEPRRALFQRAKHLREMLLADATALAGRGIIDGGVLQYRMHANGYCNIAQDLSVLAYALKRDWPGIQGRSLTTLAELDGALELAARLRDTSALAKAEASHAEASNLRDRAFTLTHGAYREIRRAVCYLREPEGDADVFAPSLTGRAR